MVDLLQLRADKATILTAAGFRATTYTGESIHPPTVVVVPGSPYVAYPGAVAADDVPFGHVQVAYDLVVVSHRATNKTTADQVDTMIADLLTVADENGWDVSTVSQPGLAEFESATYMGAVVSVTETIRR